MRELLSISVSTPSQRKLGRLGLVLLVLFSQVLSHALAQPSSDKMQLGVSTNGAQNEKPETECKIPEKPDLKGEQDLKWPSELESGPSTLFYFTEAISGKKLKQRSFELLRGVSQVTMRGSKIVFTRIDKQELELGPDTEHGASALEDWEKAKAGALKQFGPKGKQFLDSINCIRLNGDRVEVLRTDDDLSVEMGERKLHHAFDLRGLRFRKISFLIDSSKEHPFLRDIEGVTILLNAPGFCLPVDVKEFRKWKTDKGTDLTVGLRNPVPNALRTVLFMPSVIRFHFFMKKKN